MNADAQLAQKRNRAALTRSCIAAQSLKSYKPPKRFVRWQPDFVRHKLPICIPTSNRRSTLPGQHANLFQLISLPLRAAKSVFTNLIFSLRDPMVPLGSFLWWLSSTAGYVPGNEAQLSSERLSSPRRVLSEGCYPFLSGRSENLSVFLASLSASTKGVIATANRSAFALSQSLTTPFAVPSLVSKAVTLVTGCLYRKQIFWSNFCVFYFSKDDFFYLEASKTQSFSRGCSRRKIKQRVTKEMFAEELFSQKGDEPVPSRSGYCQIRSLNWLLVI